VIPREVTEVKARAAEQPGIIPAKRNDEEVELLWGSGTWKYGGKAKRD